jgi:methyl-accepting chemotaxis protein
MPFLRNLPVARKLYVSFAAVAVLFGAALAATLILGSSAKGAWKHALAWNKAADGSQLQIKGTRQQLAAQALYVATFDPKYKQEWEDGVGIADKGTQIVSSLGDPVIAKIATSANTADHHHDDTVHKLLFPAVAKGDHKAAVAALRLADHFVRIPLAAQEKISGRIEELRQRDINHAESLESRAQIVGIVLALVALALAGFLSVLIARAIRNPLARVMEAAETAASGDLTVVVDTSSHDEIGAMGTAFQRMVESVGGIVSKVSGTATSIAGASQQMAATSGEAGQAVGEIAKAINDVAAGAERQVRIVEDARSVTDELLVAARASAESAKETATAADEARKISEEGMASAEKATQAMRAVSESSSAVTDAMRSLGTKSEAIGTIVETITGIAGQTNLLALNAAIEAARAGEQGRGFAVVAEEVRKLAEESQAAAASIAELIGEIQSETQSTVGVVEDGAERTAEGVGVVDEARTAFERIGVSVADVDRRIADIAASIDQILASSQKMQQNINEVAAVAEQSSASTQEVSASSEQTSASTQQIAASADELARTAEELQRLVAQFTIAA